MKKLITLSASLLILLVSTSASAKLIEGVINFTGGAVVDYSSSQVDTVDFYDTAIVNTTDNLTTGDFDGLEGFDATFFDLDITTAVSSSLWTVGGFTFEITSLDLNEVIEKFGQTLTSIAGTGIIYSTDSSFEATEGSWALTTNGVSNEMSFSSTAVPAPAGAALLGLALLGFSFVRRDKKS